MRQFIATWKKHPIVFPVNPCLICSETPTHTFYLVSQLQYLEKNDFFSFVFFRDLRLKQKLGGLLTDRGHPTWGRFNTRKPISSRHTQVKPLPKYMFYDNCPLLGLQYPVNLRENHRRQERVVTKLQVYDNSTRFVLPFFGKDSLWNSTQTEFHYMK